jgi:hypothetical protein
MYVPIGMHYYCVSLCSCGLGYRKQVRTRTKQIKEYVGLGDLGKDDSDTNYVLCGLHLVKI